MIVKIVSVNMAESEELRSIVLDEIVYALQTQMMPESLRGSFMVEMLERRIHSSKGVPRKGMNWPYRRDYDKTRSQTER